ncbi:MAG: hypothetical protein ACM3SO_21910 [Betaproteobacteria bacterium]
MKTTSIAYVMGAVAMLIVAPAIAAEPVVDAASAAHVAYAPESPAAAFERMLARCGPVTAAPLARPAVDPLDPHFHAALWSDDAGAARVVTSTTLRTAKAR